MEIPPDDRAADLRWKAKAKRSKLPPPPPPTADEISVAEALVLLSGGFCNPTLVDTVKQHHKIPLSAAGDTPPPAAANMKREGEGSPDTPLRKSNHYCLQCGQVFQSPQALGGHMTSHRLKIADDRGCHRTSAGDFHHQCDYCHEKFATGQALGGHKRKHYDGPPLARSKTPQIKITSTAGEGSSGGAATAHDRTVFYFDLNLPPPPEE